MPVKGKKVPSGSKRQEMAHKAEYLSKKTHFSKQEVERLLDIYQRIVHSGDAGKGRHRDVIDRDKFRDFLMQEFRMTDDLLMDKVFKSFDTANDGCINEEKFVKGMSVFLKGTLQERAEFCFDVYTYKDSGFLTRDEMFLLLKNTGNTYTAGDDQDPEEMPKDLVEVLVKKMDKDHDGRLSKEDYKKAVMEEPLLVEALGPCLPNHKCCKAYLQTLCDDPYYPHYS